MKQLSRRTLTGRYGFTLIELLVVIAIIAILAAILFPVFGRARAKARQSGCVSNAKQIMTMLHMYAQDWDEKVPGSWVNWYYRLAPYGSLMKDAAGNVTLGGVMRCPEGKFYAPDVNRCWVSANSSGIRLNMFTQPESNVYLWETPCDSWASSSLILHVAIGICTQGWNWSTPMSVALDKMGGNIPFHWWPHSGGSNILFMDQHVKWHSGGDIIANWAYWNDYPMWP